MIFLPLWHRDVSDFVIRSFTVKSTIIDVETIKAIVVDLSSNEEDIAQESIQVRR